MSDADSSEETLPTVRLEPATWAGREWVVNLLDRAGLPTADLDPDRPTEEGPALYVVVAAGSENAVESNDNADPPGRVGCIGIERYDDVGLLRSAVIRETFRGQGYGAAAVRALETEARDAGIETLYLLTTTAPDFFERLGYETVDRETIPEALHASAEVSDLCPDSAVVQRKSL
jgi:amino-acid N-acetyltransferase